MIIIHCVILISGYFFIFVGDFAAAIINLQVNDLTIFEEDVFKGLLQQMTSHPTDSMGYIDIKSSELLAILFYFHTYLHSPAL